MSRYLTLSYLFCLTWWFCYKLIGFFSVFSLLFSSWSLAMFILCFLLYYWSWLDIVFNVIHIYLVWKVNFPSLQQSVLFYVVSLSTWNFCVSFSLHGIYIFLRLSIFIFLLLFYHLPFSIYHPLISTVQTIVRFIWSFVPVTYSTNKCYYCPSSVGLLHR